MSTKSVIHAVPLIDHHCHGLITDPLDRRGFEDLMTESNWAPPPGTTFFDTQIGFAIRRWCAPALGLEPHAGPEEYLERRTELGPMEANRRLMAAADTHSFLLETGYRPDDITSPASFSRLTGRKVHKVVRLERVAEEVAEGGTSAAGFADDFARALAAATADAVGLKSIMAYRHGLDFDPEPPGPTEVAEAVRRWLAQPRPAEGYRVVDPVLLRHILWSGVAIGLPIQFHVGYGDADVELHRCNPLHMTRWLKMIRPHNVDVMLLHCYPFHREAGYLAHVFPNVYCDVGLAVNYTGSRSPEIIAESLELTPFHKALYSSDAFGLAELYTIGAELFRRGMSEHLTKWVSQGEWSQADAERVARMVGGGNAARVYGLEYP